MRPGVLAMVPRLKEVLWGSDVLQRRWGKDAACDRPIGESWEVSCLPGMESGIAGSPRSLADLMRDDPEWLVGREGVGRPFPLLVKLIATARRLSVQVHPDSAQAQRLGPGATGKHESWLVLEAAPDAALWLGLAPDRDRRALEAALAAGGSAELDAVLRRVEVEPGQVWDVPPGTLHCIGSGLTLLEIQEPSDATYRVSDWGRMDVDGRPRELHLDRALQVLCPESRPEPARALGPSRGYPGTILLDNGAFRLERWRIEGRMSGLGGGLAVLVCLAGRGSASTPDGARVSLSPGRSCVVAAGATILDLQGSGLELAVARPT